MGALIKVFPGGYEDSIDDAGFIATIHNSAGAVVIAAHQGNCVVFLVVGVWLDERWPLSTLSIPSIEVTVNTTSSVLVVPPVKLAPSIVIVSPTA